MIRTKKSLSVILFVGILLSILLAAARTFAGLAPGLALIAAGVLIPILVALSIEFKQPLQKLSNWKTATTFKSILYMSSAGWYLGLLSWAAYPKEVQPIFVIVAGPVLGVLFRIVLNRLVG